MAPGLLGLILAVGSLLSPAAAADKKKPAPQALLAGTVFRDAGFSLRGAEVVVTPNPSGKKRLHWRAVSDSRGEFFIRLPAGPAGYNVVVKAAGFEPQEKQVAFEAEERLDLNFLLGPAADRK